jgi:hypothetical protein
MTNAWRAIEHDTHVEYKSRLKDLVLGSKSAGGRETTVD